MSGEINWIRKLNSGDPQVGYNILYGGQHTYHPSEITKKIQHSYYSKHTRSQHKKHGDYKGAGITNFGNFRASLTAYTKKINLGSYRTECEAGWAADLGIRKYLSDVENPYLNFPNGKTKELIKEIVVTKRLLETVKFVHYKIEFKKNKYQFRVKNLETGIVKTFCYTADENLCKLTHSNFIKDNKSVARYKASINILTEEFEKLHGSVYDLVSDEELEEAYARDLGSFI